MNLDVILQGHWFLFVCFLLWKCAFPVMSKNANISLDIVHKHHKNSILLTKERLRQRNETKGMNLTYVSEDNYSAHNDYEPDDTKNTNGSTNVKAMQSSFVKAVNNSIIISKDDNATELNLRNNLHNEMTNRSYMIGLTRVDDSKTQSNPNTKEFYPEEYDTRSPSYSAKTYTKGNQLNITESKGNYHSTEIEVNSHRQIIQRHKILKHLNLVPLEDEPFGGILWKNNNKYVMSVCIPIGVGIAGAACIIGMAYAARRCYKNERKIQEIRAALQQQITANRTDETVLLDSSDDEI